MLCCACGSRVTSSADVVLRVRITRDVQRRCCAARAAHARRPPRMLSCARGSRATSRADVVLRVRLTRDVPRACNAARAADASSASPAKVAGPKGRVARRGEALVLSDAETGSFGGAWNAKRNRVRRGPRADVVLRARRRPRTTNAPSSKRNRSARYGCQRARGLRPSCHPRSARRRAWDGMCCVRLTCADHARRPARMLCCARGSRATSRAGLHAARPADASSASPAKVAGPKGRVARRGEALVLSDAETGSFGGAWNAKRNRVRRGPRADVVLRARRRPRTTNSPSSKRNRTARYGCQRARGLRPSCHPRSARRRAWDGMCCVRLMRAAHARRPAQMLCCARGSRATSRAGLHAARPADASRTSPAKVAGPKGRVARRGEALVLSDAETGSFGGAWNAKRNRARRRPRADVVLRARRRPRTTNAPSSKRNRTARYGCQRARGLRPSCHPRSARRRAWDAMHCVRLTCGVERGMRCIARG